MPVMNFDLEDGLPPVSFTLRPADADRFMAFMDDCHAAQARDAQPILSALDFEPDASHGVADMANVGYALLQTIKNLKPGYVWSESPTEIVSDLMNELAEVKEELVIVGARDEHLTGLLADQIKATKAIQDAYDLCVKAGLVNEYRWIGDALMLMRDCTQRTGYMLRSRGVDPEAALQAAAAKDGELTAVQIAAGAAVTGDDGKPIGRNTAIMVADAMRCAAKSAREGTQS